MLVEFLLKKGKKSNKVDFSFSILGLRVLGFIRFSRLFSSFALNGFLVRINRRFGSRFRGFYRPLFLEI